MDTHPIRDVATRSLDTLLDVLVVPGFSAIGPAMRRHWWAADPVPFAGRADIVVTGAGSGLGEASARRLAGLGATVHMVGRSADRLRAAATRIRGEIPAAELVIHQADVSDLDSVGALADSLCAATNSIHALVHNAGLIPPRRLLSAQGHEMAFATHVLGPFALTLALREHLRQARDGRVVWVSSGGMYSSSLVSDLEYAVGEYKGVRAYARTKRMQVVVAEQLAEHWNGPNDPVVHSMHPGWAATPGVSGTIPGFARITKPILRSPDDGADTIVWLAAAAPPLETSGQFWHDRLVRPTHLLPWQHDDPAVRRSLWSTCLDATGVSPAAD